ncbi:S-adenosyl-L-methionine-dependent methyltransferase [Piedraia hortae CBS 480.64]|uniref:S-adenosyl-L-methionine-dependent methyltransferase n=1 Tax=Piedraia hortae CBS 480.64 TaxID=1314780 RepID=A0A6A7BU05_9PEZI|nr:S-adenosyl-L-methionine-dependent methyltransferase [Piedraia hortae CBS 480.64]
MSEEAYEIANVHDVYDKIAPHFSKTRYKPWPRIVSFIETLPPGSVGIELGCGNGKNLSIGEVFTLGSDRSEKLVKIAAEQSKKCNKSSPQSENDKSPPQNKHGKSPQNKNDQPSPQSKDNEPPPPNENNNSSSRNENDNPPPQPKHPKPAAQQNSQQNKIPSTDNKNDKPDAQQPSQSKNPTPTAKHPSSNSISDAIVADLLSPPHPPSRLDFFLIIAALHHLSTRPRRVSALREAILLLTPTGKGLVSVWAFEQTGEKRKWTGRDELVPWTLPDGRVMGRYYHLYGEGELEEEAALAGGRVEDQGWERGNWWVVLSRR